jgi:hypothetical protein
VVWLEVVCVEGWGIGLWKVGVRGGRGCWKVGLLWGSMEARRMGCWGEHGLWVGVCNVDNEGVWCDVGGAPSETPPPSLR